MGGRNKYTINGHTVDASRVHDMFQSVGLNVNNPHFLIMQGRITKVLNMKPPEILGLIEEAAGTRMFEAKKQAAQKTIEKKQVKVEELGKVLEEEITPQLKKLQEERANYLRWAANNTEVERLAKFCVAWEYTQAGRTHAAAGARCTELAAAAARHRERAAAERAAAARKHSEWSAAADRVAAARGGEMAALTDAASAAARDMAAAASRHKNAAALAATEERARAAAASSAADAERAAAALLGALERARGEAAAAAASAGVWTEKHRALQARRAAVAAGLREEAGSGSGSGGKGSTAADDLMAQKARAKTLGAEVAGRVAACKQLAAAKASAASAVAGAEKAAAGLMAACQRAERGLEAKRAALASLNFNDAAASSAAAARDALVTQCGALSEAVDDAARDLAFHPSLHFKYEAGGLGKGFDRGAVRGTVASLIRLLRPEAARAVETAAGGKLFHVVVDTDVAGAALVQHGGLKRRWDFIPLNTIAPRYLTAEQRAAAAALGKGRAVLALECVAAAAGSGAAAAALAPALQHVFGTTYICDTAETARALCFDKRCAARCVTLDGDVYDPNGTMEGGSAAAGEGGGASAAGGGAAAAASLLTRLTALAGLREELGAARRALGESEAALSAGAAQARAHARACEERDLAASELAGLQQRVSASALGSASARLAGVGEELAGEEVALAAARAALASAEASCAALELETRNAAAARAERLAGVEEELARAKRACAGAEEEARKCSERVEALVCEAEGAGEEARSARAACEARAGGAEGAAGEEARARAGLEAASAAATQAKAALAAAKEALSAADKDVKRLAGEREALLAAGEEAEDSARGCEAEALGVKKGGAAAEKAERELAAAHPWIASERAYFDKPHSDYDFGRTDTGKAAGRLSELERQQHELERRINKKVMGMIDGVEREYNDLRTKKHIIENDKAKIEVRAAGGAGGAGEAPRARVLLLLLLPARATRPPLPALAHCARAPPPLSPSSPPPIHTPPPPPPPPTPAESHGGAG